MATRPVTAQRWSTQCYPSGKTACRRQPRGLVSARSGELAFWSMVAAQLVSRPSDSADCVAGSR